MTEREKYNAIIRDIEAEHNKGRPILIGTESVDISEKLARILKQNKLLKLSSGIFRVLSRLKNMSGYSICL